MEILSWLPPETLLRFKSVHKSWYALINDPKFILKHFLNSPQYNHIFLKRIVEIDYDKDKSTFSILNFSLDPYLFVLDIDLSDYQYSQYFEIHGHSHCMVCVADVMNVSNVFLCNPATREFRKLPPSIFPVYTITDASPRPICYELIMQASDLGTMQIPYDVNSRDFKVVRVVDIVGLRRGYPV
ncbi:F-box protein At5g49610-like [Cucurbita moschata]|uniref:F-box protein At5g49610-like n=1 Tax=Cucurbita moschata TaxID=3662 RepID=A0A6J1G4V2_CUCMO|nr:F-box protein At5g49610-like [Cucurbita moschata]